MANERRTGRQLQNPKLVSAAPGTVVVVMGLRVDNLVAVRALVIGNPAS
jgi:hypothetical protein